MVFTFGLVLDYWLSSNETPNCFLNFIYKNFLMLNMVKNNPFFLWNFACVIFKGYLQVTILSMIVLCAGEKSPMQKGFFKNNMDHLLPALRCLGGLYNFCYFVNILSLM